MADTRAELIRSLGRWGIGAFVFNGMVGAGVFALPGSVAPLVGGWAPLLVLAVGLAMLPVVLMFTRLAALFDQTGGPIVYVDAGLGRTAAFQIGWLQVLATTAAAAANINLLADYGANLLPGGAAGAGAHMAMVVGALLVVLVINLTRNTRSGAAINYVSVAKALPLVLLALLAVPALVHAGFSPRPATEWSPAKAALIAAYAFTGFEGVATIAGEARDPKREMPRMMLGVFLGVALLYTWLTWGYLATSYVPGATDKASLATLGQALAGRVGLVVVTIAAVLSIFGNVLTNTFMQSRRVLALEALDALPRALGRIEPVTGLPRNAVVVAWLVLLALALSGGFTVLALLSVGARLLVYLGSLAALPVIRRGRGLAAPWHATLVYAAAVLTCLALVAQSEAATWRALGIAAAAGFAVLALSRWARAA